MEASSGSKICGPLDSYSGFSAAFKATLYINSADSHSQEFEAASEDKPPRLYMNINVHSRVSDNIFCCFLGQSVRGVQLKAKDDSHYVTWNAPVSWAHGSRKLALSLSSPAVCCMIGKFWIRGHSHMVISIPALISCGGPTHDLCRDMLRQGIIDLLLQHGPSVAPLTIKLPIMPRLSRRV